MQEVDVFICRTQDKVAFDRPQSQLTRQGTDVQGPTLTNFRRSKVEKSVTSRRPSYALSRVNWPLHKRQNDSPSGLFPVSFSCRRSLCSHSRFNGYMDEPWQHAPSWLTAAWPRTA